MEMLRKMSRYALKIVIKNQKGKVKSMQPVNYPPINWQAYKSLS